MGWWDSVEHFGHCEWDSEGWGGHSRGAGSSNSKGVKGRKEMVSVVGVRTLGRFLSQSRMFMQQ